MDRCRLLGQSEEGVVLDTHLPEGLAHIATGHAELQRVFTGRLDGNQTTRRSTHTHTREQSFIHSMQGVSNSHSHPDFVVQLDEEMFAFEAQLADLSPAECVDLGVSLHNTEGTHVN